MLRNIIKYYILVIKCSFLILYYNRKATDKGAANLENYREIQMVNDARPTFISQNGEEVFLPLWTLQSHADYAGTLRKGQRRMGQS